MYLQHSSCGLQDGDSLHLACSLLSGNASCSLGLADLADLDSWTALGRTDQR